MEREPVVVAVVQAGPVFLDRDATVDKAVSLIEEAANEGARLIAFPETWIPGYPSWIYHAAKWDDPGSKRAFARLLANSVQVPSPATDALCLAAQEAGVHVVAGIHERDADFSTGTIYNSLLFISSEGEILGTHRKLVPTHAERIVWGQGDGSTLHVFETPLGRLGGLICWEHWMPLTRFTMHAKGEQIHVAAWPDAEDAHHLASRHYAFEGRCYVLCVGSYTTVGDVPADFELADVMKAARGDELLVGGSGVIGPDGSWLSGPVQGQETIVYAELDMARIAEEQQALDAAGHYNRPDVFSLTVDERPRRQVQWLRAADGADLSVPAGLEPADAR
ncbi:MAG TPA: carbon-nitrogen hydrolase family protein [Gaiellaceae bacterium]|jgi:predicted amidohydrolase